MDDSRTLSDSLLVAASRELKGKARRAFVAKVCQSLCGGSRPKAEARFGWGRAMVARGLEELDPAHPTLPCTPEGRGRKATQEKTPQLKIDIACIVEPHTHSDPELKTERQYKQKATKMSRCTSFIVA